MCTLCQALDPSVTEYEFHDTVTGGTISAGTGTISGEASALPMYTVDQIADYLTDGYWEDTGRSARSFNVEAGGALTVDLSSLSDSAQTTAWRALDAWTAVSGIEFVDASAPAPSSSLTQVSERGDAGASRSTAQSMEVGQMFTGTIGQNGDRDWIAIKLEAGKTYSFTMRGDGAEGRLPDTLLRFYDGNGNLLEQNDDRAPGDLTSAIEFTATRSGTYYVEAAAYGSNTGRYAVVAQEGQGGSVDISFRENDSGAYSTSFVSGGEILSSSVNVSSSWTQYGSYYLQTYIHEIGHALGLGHGGNYNGGASYGSDAHYANDSWQMSVMSYFNQRENPLDDGSYLRLVTPQLADILAIQNLYGTPTTSRTGDTVYGDNHNTGDWGFGLNGSVAMTIVDNGGIDTIDLGSRNGAQYLDLRQEAFSSVGGSWGNLAIARGTVIENATTGSGNDRITGNWVDNVLRGGAGNDRLSGLAGDDSLEGGWGSDTLEGGAGNDTALFEGSLDGWAAVWDSWTSGSGGLKIKNIGGGAVDELTGIETLVFNDATIDVAALRADLIARFGTIGSGSDAQHTVALTGQTAPVNAAPTARDDAASTAEDSPVRIDLLANDRDADGDTLRVVSIDDNGVAGRVTLNTDGTATYDANGAFDHLMAGETATESFRYTIADGNGGRSTATATVTVTGVDPEPVLEPEIAPVTGGADVTAGPGTPTGQMEIGQTSISQNNGNQWHRVAFDGAIADAVVVMGPLSFNGGHASTVRVRNVTDTGFEFQIDEWDYLDGGHMTETVSWMAGSRGTHQMADGTRISFGETVSGGDGRVDMAGFEGTPIVLGQLGASRLTGAATHRIDNVSASGFDFEVQVEEAQRGSAATGGETFYWVGIEDNGALLDSGTVSAGHRMAATGETVGAARAVLADMQTMVGPDTAALRYARDGAGNLSLRVEEEQSRDSETTHYNEDVAWITAGTGRHDLVAPGSFGSSEGGVSETALLEVGTTTVAQQPGQWHRVDFSEAIADAAVVMGPVTANGGDPVNVRVRNVTDTGFEFQIDEWDYLDGGHISETVSWMAGTRGTHELADGTRITLGAAEATDLDGGRVALSGFDDLPMVFAQLTGDAEARALTHRIDNVSAEGFEFDLQLEEAAPTGDGDIADEALYWMAIDPAANTQMLRGGMADVDHTMTGLGGALDGDDAFFAGMQTLRGFDTATLRYASDTANGLQLRVEEETSFDAETGHVSERVAWFSMNDGVYDMV